MIVLSRPVGRHVLFSAPAALVMVWYHTIGTKQTPTVYPAKRNLARYCEGEVPHDIMTTAEVHVAIYDISMGMAKNMSGKLKLLCHK